MSLVISGGGQSATLDRWNLRITQQDAQTAADEHLSGRRGSLFRFYGQRDGSLRLRVEATLKGTSGADLDARWDAVAEVLDSGPVLVQDTERDRFLVAHKLGTQRNFQRPYLLMVSLDLAALDGHWTADPDDAPVLTTASVDSTKLSRYVVVDYAGTAACFPAVCCELDAGGTLWESPELEWRGRNLLRNSSFAEGLAEPDDWTVANGAGNVWTEPWGRSVPTCVRLYRDAGDVRSVAQNVPTSESTGYAISAYAATADAGTVRLNCSWSFYDAAGALISTANSASAALTQNGAWTRHTQAVTTPAGCASVTVSFQGNDNTKSLWLADAQFEQGASASDYCCTTLAEHRHVRLMRSAALDTADGATHWLVDAERRRARWRVTGAWSDDGTRLAGAFFDLQPGLNHVFVGAPTTGSVSVAVHHPNRWY